MLCLQAIGMYKGYLVHSRKWSLNTVKKVNAWDLVTANLSKRLLCMETTCGHITKGDKTVTFCAEAVASKLFQNSESAIQAALQKRSRKTLFIHKFCTYEVQIRGHYFRCLLANADVEDK